MIDPDKLQIIESPVYMCPECGLGFLKSRMENQKMCVPCLAKLDPVGTTATSPWKPKYQNLERTI